MARQTPRARGSLFIRVLLTKQGDQWLAQGLEHDLAAQGSTDQQAIDSFIRILRARMSLDHRNGREPLQGLPEAPERFFEEWDRLIAQPHEGLQTEPVAAPEDGQIPDAYVIHQIARNAGEASLNH